MQIEHPYLMFLGDAADQLAAKTAQGIVHWRRDWCVGQLKLDNCNADLGLPDMTISEAVDAGVRTLVIGVANACRRLRGAGDELVKGLVFQLERNLSLVDPTKSGTMFWFL